MGVDLGSYAVKALELNFSSSIRPALRSLGLAKVSALNSPQGSPAAPLAPLLKNLRKNSHFKSKAAALALRGPETALLQINIARDERPAMREALKAEAARRLPFSLEGVKLSSQLLPHHSDEAMVCIVLAAAPKDLVNRQAAAATEAGLRPEVMDLEALALANAHEFCYGSKGGDVLLINIGASSVCTVALRGDLPLAAGELLSGGAQLTAELAALCGCSESEAEAIKFGQERAADPGRAADLARSHARRWLDSAQRLAERVRDLHQDYQPRRLLLCGGASLMPGLCEDFARRLQLPCELFNPLGSVFCDPSQFDAEYLAQIGPQMAVSFGLALRRREKR